MRAALRALRLLPPPLRARWLRERLAPHDVDRLDVRVKIASTPEEYAQAAALIHDSYVARRLIAPLPGGRRVTPHLLSPRTVLFVALAAGCEVVGSISLVLDSPLGLPMAAAFADALAPLRRGRRCVAEVGTLAIAPRLRRTGLSFLLNKIMRRAASELLGVDDLVIAIHPLAEEIYRATLLFSAIGPVRSYPGLLEAASALPMALDLREIEERYRLAFGGEPRMANPFHLFCVRRERQIELPDAGVYFTEVRPQAAESAADLARSCPEAVSRFSADELTFLRRSSLALDRALRTGCGRPVSRVRAPARSPSSILALEAGGL